MRVWGFFSNYQDDDFHTTLPAEFHGTTNNLRILQNPQFDGFQGSCIIAIQTSPHHQRIVYALTDWKTTAKEQ